MLPLVVREWYTIAVAGMVVLASILPVSGEPAAVFSAATNVAIALLFFLQGARLSREVVIAGMVHWRLHLFVLATTFVLFPLLGLVILILPDLMNPTLSLGVAFLCVLPSTIQSSIAFTSMAEGNVPAAICSASASNVLGMVLSPLIAGLLFHTQGHSGFSWGALEGILLQLLAPFALGQILQPWLGKWLLRHRTLTQIVDRGSILMAIYAAFSEAVIAGLWSTMTARDLAALVLVDTALLAIVLLFTFYASGWLGFNRADRITVMFCGSKKSLASGAPIAKVIFAGRDAGSIVLPLMIFHQIQLMVCAVLARRFAESAHRNEAAKAERVPSA